MGQSAVVTWGVKGLEVLFRHMLSSGSVSSSAVGSQRTRSAVSSQVVEWVGQRWCGG